MTDDQEQPESAERGWGRPPDRIPMVLAAIEREWSTQPDMRLCQLLVNLLRTNTNILREDEGKALFNVEDGELLRWLEPRTHQESAYIREEPRRAREGWRAWEAHFRDSEAAKKLRKRRDPADEETDRGTSDV